MKKITQEELEKLQEQQNGKLHLERSIGLLERDKFFALQRLQQAIAEQNEYLKELEDKYGKINVDLSDGSYETIEE